MHSAASRTALPSPFSNSFFSKSPKLEKPNSNLSHFKSKLTFKSLKIIQNCSKSHLDCLATTQTPLETTTELVADKLQRLVSEFKSLKEPIDRVKRLLHYAAILPPYDELSRLPENRVTGCTTQVWLEAKMDEFGRMRFRADSDSEITKGFCSCLIWMLDGAEPEEVLKVKSEDLAEMNVVLMRKAQSRVNTWHNVLISMQKRTRALVEEREERVPWEIFPSVNVAAEEIM